MHPGRVGETPQQSVQLPHQVNTLIIIIIITLETENLIYISNSNDCVITSVLARFSGITAKMLRPITTSLRDVQAKLRSLLPANAVLVGHSVNNDLKALKVPRGISSGHPQQPARWPPPHSALQSVFPSIAVDPPSHHRHLAAVPARVWAEVQAEASG